MNAKKCKALRRKARELAANTLPEVNYTTTNPRMRAMKLNGQDVGVQTFTVKLDGCVRKIYQDLKHA